MGVHREGANGKAPERKCRPDKRSASGDWNLGMPDALRLSGLQLLRVFAVSDRW